MAAVVQDLEVSVTNVEITTPLSTQLSPGLVGEEQDEIINVTQVVTAPIETLMVPLAAVETLRRVQPLGVSRGVKEVSFAPVRN